VDSDFEIPEASAQGEGLSDKDPFFDALEWVRSWGNSQVPVALHGEQV
jgi:hypothetical protein